MKLKILHELYVYVKLNDRLLFVLLVYIGMKFYTITLYISKTVCH